MNVEDKKLNLDKFNKWKEFYDKSFNDIIPPGDLYININFLKKNTNLNLENEMNYDKSFLKKKLYELILENNYDDDIYKNYESINNSMTRKFPKFFKDRNKNNPILFETLNKFDIIFENQYKILYNVYSARYHIDDFQNINIKKKKYENYLDYISDLIYLKLIVDLNMIYILSNTFSKTDNITEEVGNVQQVINEQINTTDLNLQIQDCSKKLQNSLNKSIQNISNTIQEKPKQNNIKLNQNLTIEKLNKEINNCSSKLENSLSNFISKLNKQKGGGQLQNDYSFLKEFDNYEHNVYQKNLKNIKEAYEKGLKENLKSFNKLCKAIKEYIKSLNDIVMGFITKVENNQNNNLSFLLQNQDKKQPINKIKQEEKKIIRKKIEYLQNREVEITNKIDKLKEKEASLEKKRERLFMGYEIENIKADLKEINENIIEFEDINKTIKSDLIELNLKLKKIKI